MSESSATPDAVPETTMEQEQEQEQEQTDAPPLDAAELEKQNLDLFYDPDADEEDELYVVHKYQQARGAAVIDSDTSTMPTRAGTRAAPAAQASSSEHRPGRRGQPSSQTSGASASGRTGGGARKEQHSSKPRKSPVLSCPACFTVLTSDCQMHTRYHTQFRAMFVDHVSVKTHEVLRYDGPRASQPTRVPVDLNNDLAAVALGPDGYYAVHCAYCDTDVGVLDDEGVYHFHNVFSGY